MTVGTLTVRVVGLPDELRSVRGSLYSGPDALLEGVEGVLRQVLATVQDACAVLRFDDLPAGHYAVVYEVEGSDQRDLQFAALHFDGADRFIALRSLVA